MSTTIGDGNDHYETHGQDAFEVLESLPDNSIDCIWTDPPYFVSNGGISFRHGRVTSVDKGSWDRSRGLADDRRFHERWVAECYRILKPDGTIWASGTHHAYLLFGSSMVNQGFTILNDIIWQKPNPAPNVSRRRFTFASEVIIWAAKHHPHRRLGHVFNYSAMTDANGGRPMTNVWRVNTVSQGEKSLGRHPTQKPLALVERCLRASTHPGDIVLDPFMGSGTTGVAALRMGRRFIGIERDLGFVNIARKRLAMTQRVGVARSE